jgi:hypothetical protein
MMPRSSLPTPSLVHQAWGLRQSALTPSQLELRLQSVDDIRYYITYTDKKENKIFLFSSIVADEI